MMQLSKFMPALTGMAAKRAFSSTSAMLGSTRKSGPESVPDTFDLLPPGCSIADPTYGLNEDTTVVHYDSTPIEPLKTSKKPMPRTPRNLESAQQKLQGNNDAEDDTYVYLPPGCSIREPGYNSMSDPTDRQVYYRDPNPTIRKH